MIARFHTKPVDPQDFHCLRRVAPSIGTDMENINMEGTKDTSIPVGMSCGVIFSGEGHDWAVPAWSEDVLLTPDIIGSVVDAENS